MQKKLCEDIIQGLIQDGVRDFCICAGSRNRLIVEALENKNISTYNFVDEEGAAFFALGRAKATNKPVAIITTSGTAVSHLLPATIEAYYSGVPLVLISADRPKSYRGAGAPQAIEQRDIFGNYVSQCYDIDVHSPQSIEVERNQPVHINICLDDIKESDKEFVVSKSAKDFFKKNKKPLVIVAGLSSLEQRQSVLNFLRRLQEPCYVEPLSSLRGSGELKELEFVGLESSLEEFGFDSVIRFGDVPTLRFWRDLENTKKDVLVVNDLPFSGLSYVKEASTSLKDFEGFLKEYTPEVSFSESILEKGNSDRAKLAELLEVNPLSEVSAMKDLFSLIPQEASLFLGNSLPIRTADLASKIEKLPQSIYANRGANGIDGLISSFLGTCHPDKENWIILGDLSFIYDLNALWPLKKYFSDYNIKIVVINNNGGQIFSRVMKDKPELFKNYFENSHELNFKSISDFWGIDYLATEDVKELKGLPDQVLVEVKTNSEQSKSFWKAYDQL